MIYVLVKKKLTFINWKGVLFMPSPGVDIVFFSYKENVGLLRIMFKII